MEKERIWHDISQDKFSGLPYQPIWVRNESNIIKLCTRVNDLTMVFEDNSYTHVAYLKEGYKITHWSYVNQELENKPKFKLP